MAENQKKIEEQQKKMVNIECFLLFSKNANVILRIFRLRRD